MQILRAILLEIVVGLVAVVPGNSATASSCTGNSTTATKLQTARNVEISGAVSGNINFDGSGNVIINVIQQVRNTLLGTVVLNKANGDWESVSTQKIVDFPNGYTKDNCHICAIGIKNNANNTYGYAYGSTSENDVFVWQKGLYPIRAILGDVNNKILIEIDNFQASAPTMAYKIILEKD